MPVKMIAGLGNPGKRYEDTPHNAGFAVLDRLAGRMGVDWKKNARFQALLGRATGSDRDVMLVKPLTFMNRSGVSVGALFRYFGVQPEDLLVVVDDADLPLGRVRLRAGGGTGGHRGLASVREHLGGNAYARLRVGVGRSGENLVEHVLGKWSEAERPAWRAGLDAAADAAETWLDEGVAAAMNRCNGWRFDEDEEREPGP